MVTQNDFDHVSIAVQDAYVSATKLRAELGAVPVIGGISSEFQYVLNFIGSSSEGSRLELISPARAGSGFVHRFLDQHGETAHHLCFVVPNLAVVRHDLHRGGFLTVKEDLDYSRWQELFLPPDETHNIVIQVASSELEFPNIAELLSTRDRDFQTMPNNRGIHSPDWWRHMWKVPIRNRATLGPTILQSTNMERSHVLFGLILFGRATALTMPTDRKSRGLSASCIQYEWPSGSIIVEPALSSPGVREIHMKSATTSQVRIGDIRLVSAPNSLE